MANLSNINNKFLVTTTGEVLIGQTANNGNRLQITGADGASYIYLKTDVATTGGRIGFNSDDLRVFNQQAGGDLSFGTVGTERMKIDQFAQIFLFGQARLEVAATETNPLVGTNCAFMFQNTSNTDGNLAVIDFRNSTSFVTGRIGAQFLDAGDRDTDLYFMTRANGGSLTEKMRITSGARINMDVMATFNSEGVIRIGRYDANTSRYNEIQNSVTSTGAASYMNLCVHSGTENVVTDVMTLLGSGNVGIGTISPGAFKLSVQNTAEDLLRLHNSTDGLDSLISFTNPGGTLGRVQGIDNGGLAFDTGNNAGGINSNAMFINNTGNVGIGTTNLTGQSDRRLVLDGTFGTASIEIKKEGDRIIYFGTGSGSSGQDVPLLLFYDGGVIKNQIDSAGNSFFNGGNVGIGTTIINDPFTTTAAFQIGNINLASDNSLLTMGSGNQGSGDIYFADSRSGGGQYSGWLSYKHVSDYMTIGTAGVERMRIDGNGSVSIKSPSSHIYAGQESSGATILCLLFPIASNGAHFTGTFISDNYDQPCSFQIAIADKYNNTSAIWAYGIKQFGNHGLDFVKYSYGSVNYVAIRMNSGSPTNREWMFTGNAASLNPTPVAYVASSVVSVLYSIAS